MAELLKVVLRGATCEESATVRGSGGEVGRLQCDLPPGHPGPLLHYDHGDQLWWSAS
jgi:hypothetical protein